MITEETGFERCPYCKKKVKIFVRIEIEEPTFFSSGSGNCHIELGKS